MDENHVAVIVTTEHRGVFYGYVRAHEDLSARTLSLRQARMAIRWGTTKGIGELARSGPTSESLIGDAADMPAIHDVTAVFMVTAAARSAWEAHE